MFSQNLEEKYILAAVGDQSGHLLDIGAYDGSAMSNTRALIEQGWTGVMVEPSCAAFALLLARYGENSNIALIHGLIEDGEGATRFYDSAGGVGTTHPENFERWRARGDFRQPFLVARLSMESLLKQFGPFDFINIDAEGSSVDLFLRAPIAEMRPRAVCVEHDGQVDKLISHAGREYRAVHVNNENLILARNL